MKASLGKLESAEQGASYIFSLVKESVGQASRAIEAIIVSGANKAMNMYK